MCVVEHFKYFKVTETVEAVPLCAYTVYIDINVDCNFVNNMNILEELPPLATLATKTFTVSFNNRLLDTFSCHRFCGEYFMLICYASFSLSDIHTSKTHARNRCHPKDTDSTFFLHNLSIVPNGV